MANNVQFEVDDTSSMISYLPRGDTLSTVNLTAGWNPYFEGTGFLTALGETGRGTSMHITSLDGASLSIRWHGTGIKLYGNATDATYTISVDSAPTSPDVATFIQSENLLASVDDLSDSDHILTLTAHTLSSQDQPRSFVVFDRAILTAPPPESAQSNSSQFSLHTLIDGSISFNGEWTFDNGLGDAFRESNNAGDIAHTSFNGTSFLLTGATSPRAGNFSVTLDNTQVQLSAKSSFTNSETLLYYASGLDPDVSHNFSISNDDGSQLILPVGGLRSFSTSGPRPVASAHADGPAGYPAGTIAALALAGVLIFVLIAWLLFYLFMYRPRMRQQRLTGHVTSSPKVIEEAVIDIRRRNDSPPPTDGRKENRHVSDFQRWKRGASGSGHLGTDLLFRNSMDDKDLTGPGNIHERSDIPRGQTQNKGKGKTRWFGRQDKSEGSSPSFTLDLPLPAVPPGGTVAGSTSRNPGSWSRGSRSPHSAFSYLTSLSTPSFSSRKSSVRRHAEKDFPTSTRPEMPKFHARTSSQKPLLHFLGRRSDHIDEENSQRPTSYQSMTPYNPQDDHESLRYSRDVSVIGTTAAIRGLSPRTSEIRSTSETFHALNNTANRYGRNRDEIRPVLEMRQSSPFQVDFDRSQKHRNRLPSGVGSAVGHNERSKRTSAASHVRFEEVETSTAGAAMTSDAESTEEITEERRAPPNFRLTPLTINREAVTASFIDFSNSPSDSTRSNQPSDSSSHYPDPAVRSKWSSTQTEPHSVDPSTSPSSSTSFPFPVSLPASPHHPEGHRPSPPPRLQNVTSDDPSTLLHQHPLDYVSPTESVPLSVSTSDLRFRHSESEEMRNPQAIPPHPPLPRPSDEETTRRASPR